MSHCSQQLYAALLRPPCTVFQTLQQGRQHQLHTTGRQLTHDGASSVISSSTNLQQAQSTGVDVKRNGMIAYIVGASNAQYPFDAGVARCCCYKNECIAKLLTSTSSLSSSRDTLTRP